MIYLYRVQREARKPGLKGFKWSPSQNLNSVSA